jgi:hypothetical protein
MRSIRNEDGTCTCHNEPMNRLKDSSSKSGFRYRCRVKDAEHSRAWSERNPGKRQAANREGAWRRQGILLTYPDYLRMLEEQQGLCAMCDRPGEGRGGLHVDHCHETGKVRGILCGSCNKGLGFLQESPELLRKAAWYLEGS